MTEAVLKKVHTNAIKEYIKTQKTSMNEFSKVTIKRYSYACMVWITASYILAAFDKPINDGVTIAVITSLASVLLTYLIKSVTENVFKNKNKGDAE